MRKDRRGELFFYSHQQIVARYYVRFFRSVFEFLLPRFRYNFERLCNKLRRVERLNNLKDPIKEAYFPKLDSFVASRGWPARVEDQILADLNRPSEEIAIDVQDMIQWRDRIMSAIDQGFVVSVSCSRRSPMTFYQLFLQDKGNTIELTEFEGIDILGNIVDSSTLSVNRNFYGNLHGMGHVMLSYIHDPDNRHLVSNTYWI